MKWNNKYWLLIIGGVVFFFTADWYAGYYHESIKKHPQMYCYDMSRGVPNLVYIIGKAKKDALVEYYRTIEKDPKATPYITFGLKGLPAGDLVYVMGYTADSLLVEVVSYYDRGAHFGGSYTRGWVYYKTLHKEPPPPRKK